MEVLKENELMKINGGAISVGLALGIAAIVVFAIGVLDGYQPQSIRKLNSHV